MNNNGDKPAYAHCMVDPSSGAYLIEPGMSKRERFAMAAMQGILASSADRGSKWVAENSVLFADELLKALGS